MKNKLKYLYTFLIVALFISSCRDEDTIRIPKYKDGANVKVTFDPNNSYFNFEDLVNAKFVFNVESSNKDMEKVEFFASFMDLSAQDTLPEKLVATVTTFPSQVELTSSQLATLLGLSGIADFGKGDELFFKTKATLDDGRTFDPSNTSPTMNQTASTSSFTGTFSTFIGCASNLAGTYTSITYGESTDTAPSPNPTIDFPSQVTFGRIDPTSYTISNSFGGLYLKWYSVYGISGSLTGGKMKDICGDIKIVPFKDPFGGTVKGSGTVNSNGTITINWENEFGDEAQSIYKKK